MKKQEKIEIFGDGKQIRDFIFVSSHRRVADCSFI